MTECAGDLHEFPFDLRIVRGPFFQEELSLHFRALLERHRLSEALSQTVKDSRDAFESTSVPSIVIAAHSGEILLSNTPAVELLTRGEESAIPLNQPIARWIEDWGESRLEEWSEWVADGVTDWHVDPVQSARTPSLNQSVRAEIKPIQFGLNRAFAVAFEKFSVREREAESREYLDRKDREAEQLIAVGQILSRVAHEINNPMSVVLGLIRLLKEDPGAQPFHGDLDTLEQSASQCHSVFQELLRFTQLQGIAAKPPFRVGYGAKYRGMLRASGRGERDSPGSAPAGHPGPGVGRP